MDEPNVKTEKKEDEEGIIRNTACNICQKRFKKHKYLQRHRLKKHGMRGTGKRSQKLNYKSAPSADLPVIVKKEEDGTDSENICNICQKRFKDRKNFQRHMWAKHGLRGKRIPAAACDPASSDLPYKCNKCDKTFSSSSAVKLHMNTHLTRRPFKCTLCEKEFNQKGNAKEHLKKHLEKETISDSDVATNISTNSAYFSESKNDISNNSDDTLVLSDNVEQVDIDNLEVVVINNARMDEENQLFSHTEKFLAETADTEYIKISVQ